MYELQFLLPLTNTNIISAGPINLANLYWWHVTIKGPQNTPYEGGKFVLDVRIPRDTYPMEPPKIVFKTTIFHCNVRTYDGYISLDILKSKSDGGTYRSFYHMSDLFNRITSLLSNPACDQHSAMPVFSKLFKKDKATYES